MPIYEYLCKQCGNQFEYLLLRSSAPARCPNCESAGLEQLISHCAVHSESTTQAHLSAAHRQAAAARNHRLREEHQSLHEHFEDQATGAHPPPAKDGDGGSG